MHFAKIFLQKLLKKRYWQRHSRRGKINDVAEAAGSLKIEQLETNQTKKPVDSKTHMEYKHKTRTSRKWSQQKVNELKNLIKNFFFLTEKKYLARNASGNIMESLILAQDERWRRA